MDNIPRKSKSPFGNRLEQMMSNGVKPLTGPSFGSLLSFVGKRGQKGFYSGDGIQRFSQLLELFGWGAGCSTWVQSGEMKTQEGSKAVPRGREEGTGDCV